MEMIPFATFIVIALALATSGQNIQWPMTDVSITSNYSEQTYKR